MSAAMAVPLDVPLTWRELGPEDIDAVDRLHRIAVGPVVRPDVVKPESRSYFESILAGRGRTIGAFDTALVAYGILQHRHTPSDRWEEELGISPDASSGRLSGASVAPAFRGRSLQRATIAARVAMAPADMLLFSTAAPCNTPSWASLLAEGFPIHRIVTRYGGYARYLMVRDGAQYDVEDTRIVDPLDTPTQMTLFTQGWRGVTRTRLPSGSPGIVFARPMTNGL